jgi:D-sedoheptulose 7-phosphate isomerase
MNNLIKNHINEHINTISLIDEKIQNEILNFANKMVGALKEKKTIFWCGNGGSSSDAQHLAAELIGRFKDDRIALRSISLTADSSVLTCISNDYNFENIFSRQVEALGNEGDILIGISTSGQSQNIINALRKAKNMGLITMGLLGNGGGESLVECELSIVIPSDVTARIQESHILIGHILCDLIEEGLSLKK